MPDTMLPPTTQQPILHVDGTPDEGYVLRILQSYRANCDILWVMLGQESKSALLDAMNDQQRKRAALLDEAIARLTNA
jgi:hypothetical protein